MIKTIIIGGGVSGLACGKRLQELGEDFLLVSENLGGRMWTDSETKVNYGASYITSHYYSLLPYVEKRGRIHSVDVAVYRKGGIVNPFFDFKLLASPFKLLKVIRDLTDFKIRLDSFRTRCQTMSQKEALSGDSVLMRYVKQSASEYIKSNKLEYLHETYFNAFVRGTFFTDSKEINLFYYLTALIPIVTETFIPDFSKTVTRLTQGWENKVQEVKVVSVKRNENATYEIITENGTHTSKNIVLALPINKAMEIMDVIFPDSGVPIYAYHIQGERRFDLNSRPVISFAEGDEILFIWREQIGSDIIFSKSSNLDVSSYYSNHVIKKKHFWNPAVTLSTSIELWVDQDQGNGLYVASDNNVCGLEDAFLTGLFAANTIARK